jgi:uncharacterized protein (DUF1697 family)
VALHAALLRGVNVGGKAKVGMGDLRELFAALGHTQVTTYLQSGNVVFEPAGGTDGSAQIADAIVQRIAAEMGLQVSVLLRTGDELGRVLEGNPYLARESDPTRLHVTFLEQAPAAERADRLEIPSGETATFTLTDREVYIHCPDGYGRTKLNNAFIERKLGVSATTRNWKTVAALHEMTT